MNNLDYSTMSKREFKRNELAWELRHEDKKMSRARVKSIPTKEVLAIAYAAYRHNNETYIKDTRRFSEQKNITEFSNKELVRFYIAEKYNLPDSKWLPEDYKKNPISVTEEDYANVEEARKWMKRYVLLGLDDTLDEFKRDMIMSFNSQDTAVKLTGRIAFIPEFIKRDQHENGLKKEIRVEYRDSNHIGKEKDSVEGVAKILDQRWSSKWESYNYVAVMDGNLISFMNKHNHKIGSMKRISAKVKSHTKNQLFEANETRLNYVKVYKV